MATQSDATEESALRPGSYILVSASSPHDAQSETSQSSMYPRRRKPRCSFLLPVLALLDGAVTVTLGIIIYQQELHSHGGASLLHQNSADSAHRMTSPRHAAADERRKVILVVIAFSLARSCAYAIIGCSKKVGQLGVTVAAISILSTLFYVSIANLLFQARSMHKSHPPPSDHTVRWHWIDPFRHVHPTMSILVGVQMVFTLLEWIIYIAVVGVKIPPGSNPVKAKRWARALAKDPSYRHGVEAQSLYASDPEDIHDSEDSQEEDTDDETRLSPSPDRPQVELTRSASSPAAPRAAQPQRYGSMLDEPRTPPNNRRSRVEPNQGSVRGHQTPTHEPRSESRRSMVYARSPGAAELGLYDRCSPNNPDDSITSGEIEADDDEDEDEASDPDDIMDITPNRRVARQEARMRLAHAALPERRASGGTLAALNLFGTAASQVTPSRLPHGESANVFPESPAGQSSLPESSTQMPKSTSSATFSSRSGLMPSFSSDSIFKSSSGANTPSSSRSSFKDKKLRLPKWMKSKKKASNQ